MTTRTRTQTVRVGGKRFRVTTKVKTQGNKITVERTIR
jgi:hypothetical protein